MRCKHIDTSMLKANALTKSERETAIVVVIIPEEDDAEKLTTSPKANSVYWVRSGGIGPRLRPIDVEGLTVGGDFVATPIDCQIQFQLQGRVSAANVEKARELWPQDYTESTTTKRDTTEQDDFFNSK